MAYIPLGCLCLVLRYGFVGVSLLLFLFVCLFSGWGGMKGVGDLRERRNTRTRFRAHRGEKLEVRVTMKHEKINKYRHKREY